MRKILEKIVLSNNLDPNNLNSIDKYKIDRFIKLVS